MSGLPLAVQRPQARHPMVRLGVGAFILGIVLGILQPIFVVAVGGFGIVAGPSYVGLAFLACVAVGVLSSVVAALASATRRTTVPMVVLCTSLALGLIGGNVLASTLHVSFATPRPEPTVPEPTGAAWSAAGSMLMARHDHTATLLRDGRVLIAGGRARVAGGRYEEEETTLTAELYDPRNGHWIATGSMLTAIDGPIAVRLGDGRVLVMRQDGRDAQVYDPVSGTWSATGSLPQPRSSFATSLLADGRVLVTGGAASSYDTALASVELYDPLTGSWADAHPMSTPRMSHTATVLDDGRVLVVGGSAATAGAAAVATNAPSGSDTSPRDSAELYDPTSDAWSATGTMQIGRAGHAAALLPDATVLVLGGSSFVEPSAEIYDPASGAWHTAPKAASWMRPSAIVFRDGLVLVVEVLGGLEFYDPSSSVPWHRSMSALHGSGASATLLADGRVLFAGGSVLWSNGGTGISSTVLGSAHLLDPSALDN